jgi:hypothetical protein
MQAALVLYRPPEGSRRSAHGALTRIARYLDIRQHGAYVSVVECLGNPSGENQWPTMPMCCKARWTC